MPCNMGLDFQDVQSSDAEQARRSNRILDFDPPDLAFVPHELHRERFERSGGGIVVTKLFLSDGPTLEVERSAMARTNELRLCRIRLDSAAQMRADRAISFDATLRRRDPVAVASDQPDLPQWAVGIRRPSVAASAGDGYADRLTDRQIGEAGDSLLRLAVRPLWTDRREDVARTRDRKERRASGCQGAAQQFEKSTATHQSVSNLLAGLSREAGAGNG